jgi:hypothetical protein
MSLFGNDLRDFSGSAEPADGQAAGIPSHTLVGVTGATFMK